MELEKAVWTTSGDTVNVTMPICKVNEEKRTVTGFATLDNVDTQNDIVTSDASERAFAKWRGNIREQHMENKAVGKLLSFRPEQYFDVETGKTYNGMFVEAYISKGAQDTWEKVLDGTLSGFSLGGGINKAHNVFEKSASGIDKKIRKVVEYTITELSLVDNPANQLANIVSFQKQAGGETSFTGMLADTDIENIFYCKDDEIAITADTESYECMKCNKSMSVIGFVETKDENKDSIVKSAVNNFNSSNSFALEENIEDNVNNITINIEGISKEDVIKKVLEALNAKGGINVTEKVEATEEVVETTDPEVIEKAATVEEVATDEGQAAEVSEAEEPDLKKMLSDLTETLTGTINAAKEETSSAIGVVKEEFAKAVGGFEEKVSELSEKFNSLEEKVNSGNTQLDEVEKRIDGVVSETAMRKSGDLGGESDDLKKSQETKWGGVFLPVASLTN